ncbi:FAD-dependent monooxygenase, partial [Nocardia cyriacigeorgica]|uniref:FAD-dependent monooxygenase n=1 Tax=Nocardia cyriacigeorgica TaxID=135487 RepID=UPI00313BD32A
MVGARCARHPGIPPAARAGGRPAAGGGGAGAVFGEALVDGVLMGAGPTGLCLAVEMARRGVPHRLIDGKPAPAIGSRGKGLQPRSLEVL